MLKILMSSGSLADFNVVWLWECSARALILKAVIYHLTGVAGSGQHKAMLDPT